MRILQTVLTLITCILILIIVSSLVMLSGCSNVHYEEDGVVFDRTSYFNITSMNKFDATHDKNGKLNFKVAGYHDDKAEALGIAVGAAVEAAIKSMKP